MKELSKKKKRGIVYIYDEDNRTGTYTCKRNLKWMYCDFLFPFVQITVVRQIHCLNPGMLLPTDMIYRYVIQINARMILFYFYFIFVLTWRGFLCTGLNNHEIYILLIKMYEWFPIFTIIFLDQLNILFFINVLSLNNMIILFSFI